MSKEKPIGDKTIYENKSKSNKILKIEINRY